jgi:hypothetical protein
MSLKNNKNEAEKLLGSVLAVLFAVPISAYLGSMFGDTYNARVTVYLCILSWTILGSVVLFILTSKSKTASAKSIFLWIISVWVWPLPLIGYLIRRKA